MSSLSLPINSTGIIRTAQLAVGEGEGILDLFAESNRSSNAGLAEAGFGGGTKARVRATSVDRLLTEEGIDDVRLIKVDVEGYDSHVLGGAIKCMQSMHPLIYGEFNNTMMPNLGRSFSDVVDLTRPLGYRFFAFRDRLDLVELPSPEPWRGNMVLIPSERVVDISQRVRVTAAGDP